jgi:glycosyltransferase involved in cell wall biosynthesis
MSELPDTGFHPRVSVLVPIYNAERYLEQCLASVVSQSLQNIEVLCINDGSSDSSQAIIGRFAAADERVQILDGPNAGYGKALNRGLAAATGEYISIVESDDYVQPDMLKTLLDAAVASNADIAKSDFWLTWTEPEPHEHYFAAVPEDLAGRVVAPWREWRVIQPQPAIWSALYRRSFLVNNNIDFLESPGASFQDTSFNYQAFSAADRATLLGKAFVHYRQDNNNSSINATTKVFAVREEIERYFSWLAAWEDQAPRKQAADSAENRHERAARLRLVMQGVVYKTFRWNIRRIASDRRPEFLAYMHSYFKQAKSAGLLHPEYFEFDFFNEARMLIDDPQGYLAFTTIQLEEGSRFEKLRYYLSTEGLRPTLRRALRRTLRK